MKPSGFFSYGIGLLPPPFRAKSILIDPPALPGQVAREKGGPLSVKVAHVYVVLRYYEERGEKIIISLKVLLLQIFPPKEIKNRRQEGEAVAKETERLKRDFS